MAFEAREDPAMSDETSSDIDNVQPAAPRRPARPHPSGEAGDDLGQDAAQSFTYAAPDMGSSVYGDQADPGAGDDPGFYGPGDQTDPGFDGDPGFYMPGSDDPNAYPDSGFDAGGSPDDAGFAGDDGGGTDGEDVEDEEDDN